MSDESSAEIRDARQAWMVEHRTMYLESGGARGHIMDLTAVGGHNFGTHCLIKYPGRKSGKVFITPLCYAAIGGEVLIVASKGGADHHPAWYLNILETDTIEFQIASQAYKANWRLAESEERQALWDFAVKCYPFYADYQASTDREIPLVLLKPVEAVDRFTLSDATGLRQF